MGNISADNFFINVNETFDNIQTWKKIKLNENEINIISSFHPSYLIKYPDKKKISWEHLKNIKKKLNELSLAK